MAYHYDSLIDPTNFRVLYAFMADPQLPIDYVIHVRDRGMLAGLAQCVDIGWPTGPATTMLLPEIFGDYFKADSVLVTTLFPTVRLDKPERLVSVSEIPGNTRCDVIYIPPFYLSHTEGLFERLSIRASDRQDGDMDLQRQNRPKIKL